jgi:mutual gliding-motility protein MglA
MASINYAAREISVKIVYYGPGLSGKTTNLQIIHRKIPQEHKSDMVSLATETDRTLFFDFLPLDLGTIKGFSTKFQLYTVPGQVYYNATRKLVLRGVDGVVFVADSAADKMPENFESFKNLEDNLAEYHYKREEVPILIQYNKRDLPNALPVDELQRQFNKYNLPWTEAVANKGIGVFDSLKLMGKIVIDSLNKKYSRLSRGVPAGSPSKSSTPSTAPQPAQQPMQQQQQRYQPQPQQQYQQPQQQQYQPQPQQQYQQPQQQQYQPQPQQQYQQPDFSGSIPRAPSAMPQPGFPAQGQQPRFPSPQQQSAAQHEDRLPPVARQQSSPAPQLQQPAPVKDSQQRYGFVNFEPLPVEPAPETTPAGSDDASSISSETPLPAAIPSDQNSDGENAPAAQTDQTGQKPRANNGQNVLYPQKPKAAQSRTQIDERDYSVYHIDSVQKSTSSNNADDAEESRVEMPNNMDAPPDKQQKGFLSKFFKREEQ